MAEVQIRKANRKLEHRGKGHTISTYRVGAYVRVSTDKKEQKDSYESQVQHYKDYISQKPEWQLVEIYSDEALTGTKIDNRDNFHRMINDAMNGKLDLILVKSISRFARNTVDTLQFVRKLKDKNVAIHFEEENINTLSMDGELLLTILGAVAQQEVQNTSEHVKKGVAMKLQRGEMYGNNSCLGYDYHPETQSLTINEKEAEIVRYIFKRYLEGAGGTVIANELTNLGYKNKRGDVSWMCSTVLGIIKNEKYKGDLLMGKTFTRDPISKKRLTNMGEVDQYYTTNHHDAIISREKFDKAQEIRMKRNGSRNCGRQEKYSRQYAFSSMLKCGFCGATLSRRRWNSKTDYSKTIWQCVSATKKSKSECPHCKGIQEELLENAFVQSYNLLCKQNESIVDNFMQRIEKSLQNGDESSKLKKIEKDIIKKKERRSTLLDMRLDGEIDDELFQKKIVELDQEIDVLCRKQKEYGRIAEMQTDINNRLLEFRELLQSRDTLEKFDRHVFECIIDRVIVGETTEDGVTHPYTITFVFKTGTEDKVALKKQPKFFENACSLASNSDDIECLHCSDNAHRGSCFIVQTKINKEDRS